MALKVLVGQSKWFLIGVYSKLSALQCLKS